MSASFSSIMGSSTPCDSRRAATDSQGPEAEPSERTEAEEEFDKRKPKDLGWGYGEWVSKENPEKVFCKLCNKRFSGGVYRIKEHIAHIKGNVAPCPKSTREDQARCRNSINEVKVKKLKERQREQELISSVNINRLVDIDEVEEEEFRTSLGSKPPRRLGPMDGFVAAINPRASLNLAKNAREMKLIDARRKERSDEVKNYFSDWVYEAGISFNASELDSFRLFTEVVGQFGPGWKPASQYELRETLLKKVVDRAKDKIKPHEDDWRKNGCSIMTDAWSDRKRRSIMNLCVNSKAGTTFLSSKECSDLAHTSQMIFDYVDKCIDLVGPENVVQVVTDNASNNMGAAKLLRVKRPSIFWTSCAAHTINLSLEGIAKLPRFKKVIDQAKALTIFLYAHHKTLSMMRFYTKRKDLVRPGITRFASSFLSLQSLMQKKAQLKAMFSSSEWDECKWSKTVKGQASYTTVMSIAFWNGVRNCLTVFSPLVKLLRLADGDSKPSMGFLYGELLQAKEDIKNSLNNYSKNYEDIFEIMNEKMKGRVDTPLHLMACLLNPYYHYKDPNLILDQVVSNGVIDCLEVICQDDFDLMNKVMNIELPIYKNKGGVFGKPIAAKGCETNNDVFDPATWWLNYGHGTPNLERIAMRILSLTTSSSGCERNWSAFEGIHTKKRNRLDVSRLNNLVYVQFNLRLFNKRKRGFEKDVLLANDASKAQGWIIPGLNDDEDEDEVGDRLDDDPLRVRELEEEDFESEDEEEVNDIEFESDEERVRENYGEKEVENPFGVD